MTQEVINDSTPNGFEDLALYCRYLGRTSSVTLFADACKEAIRGDRRQAVTETVAAFALVGAAEVAALALTAADTVRRISHLNIAC